MAKIFNGDGTKWIGPREYIAKTIADLYAKFDVVNLDGAVFIYLDKNGKAVVSDAARGATPQETKARKR